MGRVGWAIGFEVGADSFAVADLDCWVEGRGWAADFVEADRADESIARCYEVESFVAEFADSWVGVGWSAVEVDG